jgi:hypothetical protein
VKTVYYLLAALVASQFVITEGADAAKRCNGRKCASTRNVHVVHHHHVRPKHYVPYYRRWYHQPYYGAVVAGVTLGTVIVVTAATAPRPPSNQLCWYWSNSAKTKGYWDYCY